VSGNVTAQIFWLKTRAGWKETQALQIGNEDGKAFKAEGAFRIQFIDAEPAPLRITPALPKPVV
jgi:hypothetical protein